MIIAKLLVASLLVASLEVGQRQVSPEASPSAPWFRALNRTGDNHRSDFDLHCQPLAGRTEGSDLSTLLSRGMDMHSGPWITVARDDKVPPSLVRLLGASIL